MKTYDAPSDKVEALYTHKDYIITICWVEEATLRDERQRQNKMKSYSGPHTE